jgi:alkyl sulfatase BDS1-like metallo-beta-lactamase superfamily hydrolase
MTIVEGRTGIIVIDALATPGAARAALDLYFAHRPRKPIVAVIYTHSHSDHFGGASGVVSPADMAAGKTKVIAPAGFMQAITGETVFAGNLTARRAQYQFGASLPIGERGSVDYGLGKNVARGPSGAGPIIPPNETIQQPMETRTVDGVTFVFQLALDSEAPSEMLIYLPRSRVLDVAEDATHSLHNLLPLRGTLVRDANRWSQYLNAAIEQFGTRACEKPAYPKRDYDRSSISTWRKPRTCIFLSVLLCQPMALPLPMRGTETSVRWRQGPSHGCGTACL